MADNTKKFLQGQASYQSYVYGILNRFQFQRSKADKVEGKILKEATDASQVEKKMGIDSRLSKYSSDEEDLTDRRWKLELAWLTKAIEPALQLCRWALPTGLFILVRFHLMEWCYIWLTI